MLSQISGTLSKVLTSSNENVGVKPELEKGSHPYRTKVERDLGRSGN